MAVSSDSDSGAILPPEVRAFVGRRLREALGLLCLLAGLAIVVAIAGYDAGDPSLNTATDAAVANPLGLPGAVLADLGLQYLGIASFLLALALAVWGVRLMRSHTLRRWWLRLALLPVSLVLFAAAADALAAPAGWPPATGLGGAVGALVAGWLETLFALAGVSPALVAIGALALSLALLPALLAMRRSEFAATARLLKWLAPRGGDALGEAEEEPAGRAIETRPRKRKPKPAKARGGPRFAWPKLAWPKPGGGGAPAPTQRSGERIEPVLDDVPERASARTPDEFDLPEPAAPARESRRSDIVQPRAPRAAPGKRAREAAQSKLALDPGAFELPPLELLAEPSVVDAREAVDEDALAQNARLLESVLNDFNVKGEVVRVRPGPVVTLYELEPAPGTKSSRIINLADDIARSMSAISVRVATVPGRNVIGIELPNQQREGVLLRELLAARAFESTKQDIPIVLGKDIGGEAVIADLARMPHLLIAGTTGSGKSVALNTMILSLLYRFTPAQLKLIMIDPKMLELSVYGDIPHLLTPVVTEPKKAVVALKWAVKEMEDRYRAMSALGVRNIHGYNERIAQAIRKKETLTRKVPVGIDPETGRQIIEEQPIDPEPLPFIVVVVDEMADLMLVAGKDIEAAIQRLAQMARAAGIHLIMATQRPSVDVITGTIKANFPTRISFQVTSKIDSRTILGEQGAEQLLGQGDMLYMAGGGRIRRVHGPFVSDEEVEQVVDHLRAQGLPHYIEEVTTEPDEMGFGDMDDGGDDLYAQAVDIVRREGKASTSFIQRKLQIGYNRAARIIEQMEERGVVSEANHVGKREVLAPPLDGPDG